jgi:hypothetical protein
LIYGDEERRHGAITVEEAPVALGLDGVGKQDCDEDADKARLGTILVGQLAIMTDECVNSLSAWW